MMSDEIHCDICGSDLLSIYLLLDTFTLNIYVRTYVDPNASMHLLMVCRAVII